MNLIKMKQKKSFRARTNMGIRYNKKVPDINDNRKPYVPVKKVNKEKEKYLAPKFKKPNNMKENFQDFLQEQLLLEWPEHIIWSDETKGVDIGWDWCSETTPEDGEWLQQLVTLYKFGTLQTLRDDRNQPANNDGYIQNSYLHFNDAQVEDITDTLCSDWGFIMTAKHDFSLIKNEKLLNDLKTYLPDRLYNKIACINKE